MKNTICNGGPKRQKEIRSNFLKDEYHDLFAAHAESCGLNVSQMTRFILMNYMRANGVLNGTPPASLIVLSPQDKTQAA